MANLMFPREKKELRILVRYKHHTSGDPTFLVNFYTAQFRIGEGGA